MDALNTLGGVQPANPLNYIRFFVTQERLPEDEIKKAKKLLQKIPKKHWRFRNPRGVAGAIIYELHRKGVNPQRNVYSQENIGRLLVVSAVTVRNTWRILFRMKEAC